MKNKLLEECKNYLKSDNFKSDFNETIKPIIYYICKDIYIYLIYNFNNIIKFCNTFRNSL